MCALGESKLWDYVKKSLKNTYNLEFKVDRWEYFLKFRVVRNLFYYYIFLLVYKRAFVASEVVA